MNRNHDPIVKATVIIVACIVATIMICVECALLPRYGWLWVPVSQQPAPAAAEV